MNKSIGWETAIDGGPRLAEIRGLKDIGSKIIHLVALYGNISRTGMYMEASIMLTVPHSGIALGVTLAQFFPPSVVTCTSPSSEPAQIRSFCIGDSTTEKIGLIHFHTGIVLGDRAADHLLAFVIARQVRTDDLPVHAFVRRFEKDLCRKVRVLGW